MEKKRYHEQHFMLDHIAKIKRSTHRMIAIIEDLLNISQMEVGTYHLKMNQICGIELLDEAIDALIPSAEKKEIKIMTNFELKEFKVKCDKEKILRVFSNLLGNALKFTPQGGQVILGTKRIDPNWVEFSISDSGPGIALENHKKVFQRFWREKKSDHEGTGLGLAIAKGIVEAHGGMIGLSEKVQKGCHFYFLLPLIKTHGDFKHQNFSRSN
jgi:signal transduction histidine kinase